MFTWENFVKPHPQGNLQEIKDLPGNTEKGGQLGGSN